MSLWSRFMYASRAFVNAFSDPESHIRGLTADQRIEFYQMAWMYYRSTIFSRRDGYDWKTYLAQRELYKHTRLIFNLSAPVADFYVDNLLQPARNENFSSLVTPLTDATDEKIVQVVGQLDRWDNLLSEGQKIKRYCAVTGNVLVEGIDDLEREKILHKTVWAGYVKEIQLSATGDVLGYTLEYNVYDHDSKKDYRFKKVVDKETFSYFRDNRPFIPPGKTAAVEENPYSFCFAVWIRHTDDGSDYGLPAFKDLNKLDEVNGLASHLHDNIHKEIESGKLIGVDDPSTIRVLTGAAQNRDGTINENDPRLERVLLAAKGNVSVHDLAGLLKLAEAHPYLKELLLSFEADYPELQAASIIQKNSQLSGAALERMLTPAQNRLDGVQANYNQQWIKFRQMGVAVAGMRQRDGSWTQKTDQQKHFQPFDLKSYEQGKLDFQLKRSLLVQNTDAENEELYGKKLDNANTKMDGLLPLDERLKYLGYNDEDRPKMIAAMQEEQRNSFPQI